MKHPALTLFILLITACTLQPTTTPTGELTTPETTTQQPTPEPTPPIESTLLLLITGNSSATITISSAALYNKDNNYWATLTQDDKTLDLTKGPHTYTQKNLPVSTYNQLKLTINKATTENKEAIFTTNQLNIPLTITLQPNTTTTITLDISPTSFHTTTDNTPIFAPTFTLTTPTETKTLSTDINGELGANKKIDTNKKIIIKNGKPAYQEDLITTTSTPISTTPTAAITKKLLEFKKPQTMEEKREALHESVISIAEGDKKRVVIVQ